MLWLFDFRWVAIQVTALPRKLLVAIFLGGRVGRVGGRRGGGEEGRVGVGGGEGGKEEEEEEENGELLYISERK